MEIPIHMLFIFLVFLGKKTTAIFYDPFFITYRI